MGDKRIQSALISVYYKDGLEVLLQTLHERNIDIYSTGGTAAFIASLGYSVKLVENLTGYPSILGGRVKTLHPAVFGGILARREEPNDLKELNEFNLPLIDLVVVDLYPFEESLKQGASEEALIEKIDIGGVSLIRAAAKNFKDTAIVSRKEDYAKINRWLNEQGGSLSVEQRKSLSATAFEITRKYDTLISGWMNGTQMLRYGENPHQQAWFDGDLNELFIQLHGKELSYNNLLDVDSGVRLVKDLDGDLAVFAILKHNNACGLAMRTSLKTAYLDALAGDPVSAFGGVLVTNKTIDISAAEEMNKLFFEICIAPDFEEAALEILSQKKNRILLRWNMDAALEQKMLRTILNGQLIQDCDTSIEEESDLKIVSKKQPGKEEIQDLLFANVIVKHTKSNAIVLAKNGQLLASGTGQTSRVDALRQAIHKANSFGFELKGAVMASDAFFPFPDCVEIASEEGIAAVIQPGGSIKDELSVQSANERGMAMAMTGVRHFRH